MSHDTPRPVDLLNTCHMTPPDLVTYSCVYTDYVNTYDHVLNYRVPDGYIIRGVNSVHDNGAE